MIQAPINTKYPAILVKPLEMWSTTWVCRVALPDLTVKEVVLEPWQIKCKTGKSKPGHVELMVHGGGEAWFFIDPNIKVEK